MAETREQREAGIREAYRRYLGRDIDQQGLNDFLARGDISLADRTREILGSREFADRQNTRATNLFEPAFQGLDRDAQGLDTQYQDLIQGLERRKKEMPEEVLGQFSRRGLLRSDKASEALTQESGALERQFTSASRERASRLADLAARRAELVMQQQDTRNQLMLNPSDQFEKELQQRLQNQMAERQLREQLASREASQRQIVTSGGQQRLIDAITGSTVADLGAAGSPAQFGQIIGGLTPDQVDGIPDNILQAIGRSLGFEVI